MTSQPKKLLSICVPVLNEEDNIRQLHETVTRVLEPVSERYDLEFVFTDNCSTDNTWGELELLSERDPRVRAFRFSRNFGFQHSILTGFGKARGDAIIQLDCDLQDPPEVVLEFLRLWDEGAKVVFGIRRSRKEGWLITAIRRVFYRLINALSEHDLPSDAGDFRLIDRRVLDELLLVRDDKPYLRGTLVTLGFKQIGVAYDRDARARGASKFPLRALFALAFDGILSHSTVPLRMATYTGLVVSLLTFLGLAAYLVGRLFFGQDWPAGFATTTILQLLGISLNALFLGVIGEYVGRIYHQVRKKPFTIIENSIDPPGVDRETIADS